MLFSKQFQYKGYIEALLSTLRNFNLFSVLEMYSIIGKKEKPVLAIWGKLDGVVPFSGSKKLKQSIPQAELFVIEEGTHDITYRQPSQVSEAIVKFLLKSRAYVNERDKTGSTPLFYAIRNKNINNVKILLYNKKSLIKTEK